MQYKFTQADENYEMYASGGILYALPGHPNFPIRLTNEIFRRCLALREAEGASGACVIYDPCCGGAYHLTTLAYFNWPAIRRIIGSDIDADALALATRNLSLLDTDGLDNRIREIDQMHQAFGKASHAAALHNAHLLKKRLITLRKDHPIETHLFPADVTDSTTLRESWGGEQADIVITDIPYGRHSDWHADTLALSQDHDPVHQMLQSLLPVLGPHAMVAVAAAKKDTIQHARYKRLDRMRVGKRQVVILRPILNTEASQ